MGDVTKLMSELRRLIQLLELSEDFVEVRKSVITEIKRRFEELERILALHHQKDQRVSKENYKDYRILRLHEAREKGVILAEANGCRLILYQHRVYFDGCWSDATVASHTVNAEDLYSLIDKVRASNIENALKMIHHLLERGEIRGTLLKVLRNPSAAKLIAMLASEPELRKRFEIYMHS